MRMPSHINVGAGIVAVTMAVLAAMTADTVRPSRLVQTDYCWFDQYVAANVGGVWLKGWAKGYGPCSQQDIYRRI